MRINYKKFSALKFLQEDSPLVRYPVVDDNAIEEIAPHFNFFWPTKRHLFKDNIECVANPFYNAAIENSHKIPTNMLLENLSQQHGVFIIDNMTICYSIESDGKDYAYFQTVCFRHDVCVSFDLFDSTSQKTILWVSKTLNQYFGSDFVNKFKDWVSSTISIFILFKKYAQVETKHLPPNKKIKDQHCKYFNETPYDIQILDSTWFTTLVKSDAFKVRGHFRLQPCGEGLKDKKLIWINEFQKSGYTREAKKLATD